MSSDATFFRNQATVQRANAADATLDNVRERSERAAASWEAMASRAERAELRRKGGPAAAPEHDDLAEG